MARIDKRTLTKLEIIQVACKSFLENGYTDTSIKTIGKELDMSPGNVTFYFPTKEHLLAELVELMCKFQWLRMEQEANEGNSSVMAICLELMAMASMCETNEIARDFYLAAYTSPVCLERIRKNDAKRAREVFRPYRPDWSEAEFSEAEILVSGMEYATLMASGDALPLELRIQGALDNILGIFGVPEETRAMKLKRVLSMDYRGIGGRVFRDFKKYVEEANEQALRELLTK
ncbi:MAG: TetR/AcrR family transcriptional regulator [Oscillospiraceae bacterium]|nr:TetR/AcrR family transcriptional regulator [Oscillospiraceae bacterium]